MGTSVAIVCIDGLVSPVITGLSPIRDLETNVRKAVNPFWKIFNTPQKLWFSGRSTHIYTYLGHVRIIYLVVFINEVWDSVPIIRGGISNLLFLPWKMPIEVEASTFCCSAYSCCSAHSDRKKTMNMESFTIRNWNLKYETLLNLEDFPILFMV